jgi:hypothetical protein
MFNSKNRGWANAYSNGRILFLKIFGKKIMQDNKDYDSVFGIIIGLLLTVIMFLMAILTKVADL